MVQCVRKYGIVRMVLWDCSLKIGELRHFTGTVGLVGFSRLSRVRVQKRKEKEDSIYMYVYQGWARDVNDRDETEMLASPAETRPRQDVEISRRDRDETFAGLET